MSRGMREPFGFSNSKRRAAGTRHAIGDFRDLQDRIDFHGDAPQFAFFFEPGNEFAQIAVRQNFLPYLRDQPSLWRAAFDKCNATL